MQIKTIKSVLRRKVDSWAASVSNPEIAKIIKEQTIVTGGAVTSMLMQEDVNDFDVYFRTGEAAFKVANYYVARMNAARTEKNKDNPNAIPVDLYVADFERKYAVKQYENRRFVILAKSAGVAEEEQTGTYQYFEVNDPEGTLAEAYLDDVQNAAKDKAEKAKDEFRPVFMSSNAITLSDKIQIVIRFFGEPAEIHANYDFVHCMCSWTSWDGALNTPQESLHAMMSRTLVYVGSLYPVCSMIRTRKFIQRGWRITAGQYLKIAFQISDMNLRDIKVLEDQLTGVDSAFFAQLISIVQKDVEQGKKPEDIDAHYISQLVDRIF